MPDPKTDRALDDLRGAMMAEFGKVHTKVDRLEGKVDALDGRLDRVIDDHLIEREENARYRRKTKAHEHELERLSAASEGPDWKPNPSDNTGTHELAVLKAQHAEDRADKTQWRWQLRGALLAAALAAIVGIASGCITYVWARLPPVVHPK